MEKIISSGKRKTAVARAILFPGKGNIRINNKGYQNLDLFDKLQIEEPLKFYKKIVGCLNFDVEITVKGGGEKSQIGASKLALSKAMISFSKSKELSKELMGYDKHLVVADTRRKETYKPGDSKARSKRQSSKR